MTTPAVDSPAKRREQPGLALVTLAPALVGAAAALAGRLGGGGTLHVFGDGDAESDAHHVAVEFVHPVIVGKPALPALAHPAARAAHRLRHTAEPRDVALALCGPDPAAVEPGLHAAAERGLLALVLCGPRPPQAPAAHTLALPADDPLILRELRVSAYHLLWELAHVLLEHDGARRGGSA
ncbi:hypothetical protein Cs7R123_18410 [Catellatospora sp. TT07R-123]|uniref:hypothetical protein n=1 Tax=Catellatospora sp. TT07R-123 TaxID=2733863 RepID=UPI001B0A064C|nr:hypothetical protein [Catellatospora sp. TT07R-123]GHJ44499.1 hypothetical protein Cs7R123_18410 [Catellatospora sp. TT07R-123]